MKEKRRRKRRFKKKSILILFLIIILIRVIPSFGRYTYNSLKEMYLSSKKFYFTSNLLGENKSYTNWGGSEVYVINFELYSYDNKLRKMEEDLNCVIEAKINRGSAKCYIVVEEDTSNQDTTSTLNKTIGTLNNKIKASVYIVPTTIISNGETVVAEISATSTSPYSKKLTSVITLNATEQSDYEIRDAQGKDYAELILSNSKEEDVLVSLTFDVAEVKIDSNNKIFEDTNTTYTTTANDGVNYISSVTFKLSKESAKQIKFYKINKKENYTYKQNDNETSNSIINVSV